MSVPSRKLSYEPLERWGDFPRDWRWGWIVGLACDSQDRVFVYSRSQYPLTVFDREGNLLETWGEGVLMPGEAHGLFIDAADQVYCTDATNHCVHKFNRRGEHLQTLGSPGVPAEIEGAPFNKPTDVGVASTGELFVSDGYGQTRIHKFTVDGQWLLSWGERGTGPGEFVLPHSVRVDREDRVWVCDRTNNRIQIFDLHGRFLEERTGLLKPNTVCFDPQEDIVYVAELEHRVSILSADGTLIARLGDGETGGQPGHFLGGAHGIAIDSRGDLYVGEVLLDENGRMQKFRRKN